MAQGPSGSGPSGSGPSGSTLCGEAAAPSPPLVTCSCRTSSLKSQASSPLFLPVAFRQNPWYKTSLKTLTQEKTIVKRDQDRPARKGHTEEVVQPRRGPADADAAAAGARRQAGQARDARARLPHEPHRAGDQHASAGSTSRTRSSRSSTVGGRPRCGARSTWSSTSRRRPRSTTRTRACQPARQPQAQHRRARRPGTTSSSASST